MGPPWISLAIFICFAVPSESSLFSSKIKHLSVKYDPWDGYYSIPTSLDQIVKSRKIEWGIVDRDKELDVFVYSYYSDPRVSILIDQHGSIAGLRVAFLKEDVYRQALDGQELFFYDYNNKPIFSNGTIFGKDAWYTSVLFVSPETLKDGGRSNPKGVVVEDVYLKLDGTWTKIPKDECQAKALGFTKQGCFVGMGMHYFYKVTPDTDCRDYQGVFLLFEQGQIIGLGFNPFGSFTTGKGKWFEKLSKKIIKTIVPNGPKCMNDLWVDSHGVTYFHIFFKRFPKLTFCNWPWQKSNQCPK